MTIGKRLRAQRACCRQCRPSGSTLWRYFPALLRLDSSGANNCAPVLQLGFHHAAEFLVLDRLFPRSILAALASAEACLDDLEPSPGRVGVRTEAQRILGRARTDLAYRSPDDLLVGLGSTLASLQRTCSAVNEAISARYFRQTAAVAWTAGAVA